MAALIDFRSLEKACVPVLFSLETLIRRKNPLTICFKKLTFKSAFVSQRVSYFAALETGSAFRQGFPNFLTQQSHLEHFSTETETLDLEDKHTVLQVWALWGSRHRAGRRHRRGLMRFPSRVLGPVLERTSLSD